jgi:hypothetical protein
MTNEAFTPSPGVWRRLVPPLAAVTVLAVLLGGGLAVRRASKHSAGSGGAPAVLRLADYQAPAAAAVDGSFRLSGDLPAGPSSAGVRWLTAPSRDAVERLATALGIRGEMRRASGATTYTSGSGVLRVQQGPGGSWHYARAMALDGGCPPGPGPELDDPSLTVSCAVAVPVPPGSNFGSDSSTGPSPGPGAISEPPVTLPTRDGAAKKLAATTPDQARAAARPVFAAVGIDPADAVVRPGQPQSFITADPTVEHLATYDLATSLTVFGQRVDAADGWLGGSATGATYPVISARAAWKQLTHTPFARPLIACPEPLPADSDPLICGGPITVTGARFGLSLHESGGRPVLVPSWLFDVRGSDNPLSVVAVDPRYLAAPAMRTMGGGKPGSSGSGSSGSGSGGTVVPPVAPSSNPVTMPPYPPLRSPDPAAPESRFSSVKADGSRTLLVSFTGGVDTCFSYTVVPAETDRSISLTLVEKSTSEAACVEMAQVYERRVLLAKPLGTRKVVDAETGAVLLGPTL